MFDGVARCRDVVVFPELFSEKIADSVSFSLEFEFKGVFVFFENSYFHKSGEG